MGTFMSIPCEFDCATLYDVHEINSSFATGKLKVMYLGHNRNGSHFTKDAVEKALPSLRNVPIVCHWDEEAEEIGGHDVAVVSDGDGGIRLKNLTEPCGVVPDHASFYFQKCYDESGAEHEYLVIDGVILWKRQDVYKHIVNDLGGVVKHSMEINVFDGNDTPDGYYDISKFEFTALCLLENCEPCFQGSTLEVFSAQSFKQKMEQMMLEIKEFLTKVDASNEDDIHPQNNFTEGGETLEETIETIVTEEVATEEVADEPKEDPSEDSVREEATATEASEGESTENTSEESTADFALTEETVEEICRNLEEVTIEKEYGTFPRYYYVDSDFDAKEVYCWDSADWLLYGFTYEKNGDSVVIDFESKARKKFVIADFDEGDQASPVGNAFAAIEKKAIEANEFVAKYQEASSKISEMEPELEELRAYRDNSEKNIASKERADVLAKFEDLEGNESFDSLKEHCDEYDPATLEEKCYAIRGRCATQAKFSFENRPAKICVDHEYNFAKEEPYGGLFTELGTSH